MRNKREADDLFISLTFPENSSLDRRDMNLQHTITYQQAPLTENRWIRLEQEEHGLTEAATVAEAARLIDALYGMDACTQGLSGGGNPVDETDTPAQETFDIAAANFMGEALCASDEYWTARVRVMTSHQDSRPVLQTESAEIVSTEPIQRRVSETLELSNGQTSVDLTWPYAGNLSASLPAGTTAQVLGSTLNLSRPLAQKYLRVSYSTRYERVRLRVPVAAATPAPDTSVERGTPQEAALIAFWSGLASLVALEEPERDRSSNQALIDSLCSRRYSGKTQDKECTRTVEYYKRCRCSGSEANGESRQEQEDCSCGKKSPGSHLGLVRRLEGYTNCENEDDEELTDPEYYKEQCCKQPARALPQCKEEREEFRGGEGIQGGAAYYQAIYGENVRLEAVTPEGGSCGEKIRHWNVEPLDCCLEIEQPLQAHPDNPNKISKGERLTIRVFGGRQALPGEEPWPLVWEAYGGLVFEKSGTSLLSEGTAEEVVIAKQNICHQPWIVVDDKCKPVTLKFEGVDEEVATLSARSLAIEPETTFEVSVVEHGVAPFTWYCNDPGVTLVSQTEDGRSALFRAGPVKEWCVATVYCNDVCGKTVTCDILNARTGKWVKTMDFPIEFSLSYQLEREIHREDFPIDPFDPPDRYAGGWPVASLSYRVDPDRPVEIAPGFRRKLIRDPFSWWITDEIYADYNEHYHATTHLGYSVPINGKIYEVAEYSQNSQAYTERHRFRYPDKSIWDTGWVYGHTLYKCGGPCPDSLVYGWKFLHPNNPGTNDERDVPLLIPASNVLLDQEWRQKKNRESLEEIREGQRRMSGSSTKRGAKIIPCGIQITTKYKDHPDYFDSQVWSTGPLFTEHLTAVYEWICGDEADETGETGGTDTTGETDGAK